MNELRMAQGDGSLPTTLVAGAGPGESGVSVLRVRFQGSAHLGGTLPKHFICFLMSPRVRFECRLAGRTVRHEPSIGSLAICPAGVDWDADGDANVDSLVVTIDPGQLSLAAAEDSAPRSELIERFAGDDPVLLALARSLALEASEGCPNGPLFWHDVGSRFVDRLVTSHTAAFQPPPRTCLSKDVLARIREYVAAHLDEPIEVGALARISGRSAFHFSRVFSQSVGMSPYRYVVHLRLRRALELAREGRFGLGEIALLTGFADQSHLTRWIRRVYGVSPRKLLA